MLAIIRAEEREAEVILLTESPFSGRLNGNFAERLRSETIALRRLVEIGPIAVDVPIDLQGLPLLHEVNEPWELTKRPVDKAFDGLAPLASWLGACVVRFASIMPSEFRQKELGVRIFETYPAASLQQLFGENDPDVNQYKLADKKKVQIAADARLKLCRRLRIEGDDPVLTHDEVDAIICAIAAVATPNQLLPEKEFCLRGSKKLPIGYRVLNKCIPFERIRLSRKPFEKMIFGNDCNQ